MFGVFITLVAAIPAALVGLLFVAYWVEMLRDKARELIGNPFENDISIVATEDETPVEETT